MSPPEVWGPAVWILLHTLPEKINDIDFAKTKISLFNIIKLICKNLPCPYCANDATRFLEKVNINKINNKQDFKNMLYMFHNRVNLKKKKNLLNFTELDNLYKPKNLLKVIINFIKKYNTKGNMQLLNESFHRQMVIKEFKKWVQNNKQSFNWGV
jgi:uncharacterized membrane protein YheB (UPF0754 family)